MTRIAITILSITLIALAGCGEDGSNSENGGNGDNNNDEHFVAGFFASSLDQEHAGLRVNCECNFADWGDSEYADAEECYEDNAIPDSNRDDAINCIVDAVNDYDSSPPQTVAEQFECGANAFTEGEDCVESATDAEGEVCSEDADAERQACNADMNTALDACDDVLDEDGQAWMDDSDEDEEFNASVQTCFDLLSDEE